MEGHDASQPRVAEPSRKSLDILPQGGNFRVSLQGIFEVLEFFTALGLNPDADFDHTVQEFSYLFEVCGCAATRRHRWRADPHSSWRERRSIPVDRVPVQRDGRSLASFLNLGSRQAMRSQIKKDQVIVRAVACELMTF